MQFLFGCFMIFYFIRLVQNIFLNGSVLNFNQFDDNYVLEEPYSCLVCILRTCELIILLVRMVDHHHVSLIMCIVHHNVYCWAWNDIIIIMFQSQMGTLLKYTFSLLTFWQNVEVTNKRYLLCVDASKSMDYGNVHGSAQLRPMKAAACMVMVTGRSEPNFSLKAFSSKGLIDIDGTPIKPYKKSVTSSQRLVSICHNSQARK